jgi:hypothetical protein
MHKPKKRSDAVLSSIRLPRDLHDWMSNQPGGMSDTIKRGFEMLRIADGADKSTLELAAAIFGIAHDVEIEAGGKWHSDGKAHRAFRRALLTAISKWRPADYNDNIFDLVELAPLDKRPHASHPVQDADALGIAVAYDVLEVPDPGTRERVRAAREKTLQEILKLQQNRGSEGND